MTTTTTPPAAAVITTINPATGAELVAHPVLPTAAIEAAVEASAAAQREWAATDLRHRGELIAEAAAVLRRRSGELALLVTREMGKPLAEARAEVEKSATACDWYAEHAAGFLAGGRRLEGPGWFYAPTVLADVAAGMPAYDEEVFGAGGRGESRGRRG
jgi:acyl-CoA reductase-like NAD-dependent aldehyde dehydrogenase